MGEKLPYPKLTTVTICIDNGQYNYTVFTYNKSTINLNIEQPRFRGDNQTMFHVVEAPYKTKHNLVELYCLCCKLYEDV